MDVNEENMDEDFFEEYGEEMTKAFLSFCDHFREYVCEMNEDMCRKTMEETNAFAKDYGIVVTETDGDYYYNPIDENSDETTYTYGIIQLLLKFTDLVKAKDVELWDKAIHYAADYGGVGRIQFSHIKEKKKKDDNENFSS